MKIFDRVLVGGCARGWSLRVGCALLLVGVLIGPVALGHSPLIGGPPNDILFLLSDWCGGAFSNTAAGGGRIEDHGTTLTCGTCAVNINYACQTATDCPDAGEACLTDAANTKVENIWWDNRTDGAVNDLGTVITTHDDTNMYFAAELWVDPDPLSLPFAMIAIDHKPGGNSAWHDPASNLTTAGTCTGKPDRACTSDADCSFCAISTEPFPSTRVRACGSGCNPDIPADTCDPFGPCTGIGTGGDSNDVGLFTDPDTLPEYLLIFDFSRWLAQLTPVLLNRSGGAPGAWIPVAEYDLAVNPGASGGSGGPPGSVEVAIPWSDFEDDFGPGDEYSFTLIIARGDLSTAYRPAGAIEDVMSEEVAGTTTTTEDSCPGFGIGNTLCEMADGSTDAFTPSADGESPGGRTRGLRLSKSGSDIAMSWLPSCSSADSDYGVYEGTIGSFGSHAPKTCTTSGTTATITPGGGDHYYLVAPHNDVTDGSYGLGVGGAERLPGAGECNTQSLGDCP